MSQIRIKYAFAFIGCIILGLLSRRGILNEITFVHNYVGDSIWAAMVYFLISSLFTSTSIKRKIIYSTAFSFGIEFSQLIDNEHFNTIRDLPGMRLVFGYGFKWSDLVCYLIGILFSLFIDVQFLKPSVNSCQ